MKDIMMAPFVCDMRNITEIMYRLGWDERNGGNISYLLDENQVAYLRTLPPHLELEVNGNRFYMVHGFPGDNVHDEVWTRPTMEAENPIPDCRLIIGHTKVLSLIEPQMERLKHAIELEDTGDHLKILHTPGFINLDCGSGYDMPIKALACIRLDDMIEFYA